VPSLAQLVFGALAGHGQPIQLARQALGKIAHVDHFLHLAQAFAADFAHFQTDQLGQCRLVLAHQITQHPHHRPALGGGDVLPSRLGLLRLRHLLPRLRNRGALQQCQALAINGAVDE